MNMEDKLYFKGKMTWFYQNCRRQRHNKAKICDVCPFRKDIEEFEESIKERRNGTTGSN